MVFPDPCLSNETTTTARGYLLPTPGISCGLWFCFLSHSTCEPLGKGDYLWLTYHPPAEGLRLKDEESVVLDVGNFFFPPQALQNIAAISLAINYPNKATRLWNVEC